MILSTSTDKLQLVLGAGHTTNPVQCLACWEDHTGALPVPDRKITASNGTNAVDIVPAPTIAAGTWLRRKVTLIYVYNADTVEQTATIRYNENGSTIPLATLTLAAATYAAFTTDNPEFVVTTPVAP
jgi:hypothetical protein